MKKRIKINGFLIAFTVLLILIFPGIFFNQDYAPVKTIRDSLGIGIILLGQLLRISARGYKSTTSQNGHALTRGGPYTLVRHPMYLGIILIGLGIVLMLFRWWMLILFTTFFIIRYLTLIVKEEKYLAVNFKAEYVRYKTEVRRRILPSLGAIVKVDVRQCLPIKQEWLKKELSSVIPVLVGVLSAASIQNMLRGGLSFLIYELTAGLLVVTVFIILIAYLIRCQKTSST